MPTHAGTPLTEAPLIEVRELSRVYHRPRTSLTRPGAAVHALRDVSLTVRRGERYGIVGESGSGKSTLLRLLCALDQPTGGSIRFDGQEITGLPERRLRFLRENLQIVFQDPMSSLDPRMRVRDLVAEPLAALGLPAGNRVAELLEAVGLPAEAADRYPHQFSGGQRQRIAIARALVLEPRFVMLDEPTSALDMSVQAQVVDLLRELQERHNLSYLFISHDLKVVRALANDVIVMRDGKVVEAGTADEIFDAPRSDYTRALMAAAFALQVEHVAAVRE